MTRRSEPNVALMSLNTAVVAFADEILRLPSPSAAATALDLLYGREVELPRGFLEHVSGDASLPLNELLASPVALAALLPERLWLSSACRAASQALKGARAAARGRYRELQAAFVTSSTRVAQPASAALVRYTYGADGRHWLWADASKRVLDRVVALNRTVLTVLSSIGRGESPADIGVDTSAIDVASFDLPAAVLDVLAEALAPLAVPDFARLTAALEPREAGLRSDESILRYQSLFAEILGLTGVAGVPA